MDKFDLKLIAPKPSDNDKIEFITKIELDAKNIFCRINGPNHQQE